MHAHSHATEDWRILGALALVCGLLGLVASLLEAQSDLSGTWVLALYVLAMLAGGWDALVDVKEGLPKGELDIHFCLLYTSDAADE